MAKQAQIPLAAVITPFATVPANEVSVLRGAVACLLGILPAACFLGQQCVWEQNTETCIEQRHVTIQPVIR